MKKVIYVLILITSTFILSNTIKAWSEYTIGQEVEYNGINFYVIKDSGTNEDSVTMLKAEPLTVEEVNLYGGVGTANNHVNMYVTTNTNAKYYQTAFDNNGYGGMAYYSSYTCGYNENDWVETGCTVDYAQSEIKYVVDAWVIDKIPEGLKQARLLTIDELGTQLGYEWKQTCSNCGESWVKTDKTPTWVYNSNYWYWTESSYQYSFSRILFVHNDGLIGYCHVNSARGGSYGVGVDGVVRPVITLSKIALGDTNDIESDETENKDTKEIIPDKQDNNKKESSTKVMVANTYMKTPIIIMLLGFIIAGIGVFIYFKLSNKKK